MRLLVVVSVLDRCSAVWRFGAGGLVVVLVVVLVNCFYFRNTFHSTRTPKTPEERQSDVLKSIPNIHV